jgi:hypothetical protein
MFFDQMPLYDIIKICFIFVVGEAGIFRTSWEVINGISTTLLQGISNKKNVENSIFISLQDD